MNIYHVLVFAFPNAVGFKGARVLNTLYVLELGANPLDIGLLLAMYAVFPLLLAVYVGKTSDRYGVRVLLAVGMLAMALGVSLPFFWPALPALFVAAAVIGAGFILVQVSTQSLTGSLGSGEQRIRNFNLHSLAAATADLAGPVLAGVLIDTIGHARTYPCLTALIVISLIGVAFMFRRVPAATSRPEGRESERMADLLPNRDLRRIFVAGATVFTGLDPFQLYMPLYGHSIDLSASAIGMVLGAFAAAAFVTRILLPWFARRFGEQTTLIWALYLAGATFMLIPFSTSAVVLGTVSFMLGLGLGLGQPLSVIPTCNNSPPGSMGEAPGLRITINNVVHIVAPAAFGAVGSLFGLAPVFWITAGFLTVGSYAGRKQV